MTRNRCVCALERGLEFASGLINIKVGNNKLIRTHRDTEPCTFTDRDRNKNSKKKKKHESSCAKKYASKIVASFA